jgi:hypothetical protein
LIVLVLHDDLLCEEAGVDGRFVEGEVLFVREMLGLDFLAGQIDGAATLLSKRRARSSLRR